MLRACDYLLIIFVMMNVISFSMYGIDKYRAFNNLWRIRESVLLAVTWLMGGVGAWLGMRVFRHKTKHRLFRLNASVASVIQLVLFAVAFIKLAV